jgi:hypothetical protein
MFPAPAASASSSATSGSYLRCLSLCPGGLGLGWRSATPVPGGGGLAP